MKKRLLITYDHELFLGKRSGQPEDCMLKPAKSLLDVMRPYNIRAIFFVDTTYLLRLKEQSATSKRCADDFIKIADQLDELVANGHYVFPHIHPHWIDAGYDEGSNNWNLAAVNKYRFHNISDAERDSVFTGSVNLLKEILHKRHPGYEVNGYRAGGWCIQPFTDFLPYFEKNGIKYEFSVLSGFYQFTDAQYFDFSDAPEKPIYRFSTDVCTEDQNGPFTEFSIDMVAIPGTTQWLNKFWIKYLYRIKKDHSFNRGSGHASGNLKDQTPLSRNGMELGSGNLERISVETLTSLKQNAYLNHLTRNDYMHFLSHPKMITGHNVEVFSKFLQTAFTRFEIETDFRKML